MNKVAGFSYGALTRGFDLAQPRRHNMDITFGLALDGWRSANSCPTLDHCYCGPTGLVGVLELRLGLATPKIPAVRRIVEFQAALLQAQAERPRFYTESYTHDALGTAETLLQWRDELRLAGWDGTEHETDSIRLRDLAAVEASAGGVLSQSLGDRLSEILYEMEHRSPCIDSVQVVEDSSHLPLLLRRVLEQLGARFNSRPFEPRASVGTNLRCVQESLVSEAGGRIALNRHDDSIVIYTAYSEITLAHFAAQAIEANRARGAVTTLVATAPTGPLEAALGALDAPLPAIKACSTHRPVLQVLPLALRLRWSPLDPRHLLEFLSHPVNPLRRGLRTSLARVVSNFPGLGSAAWDEAIANSRAAMEQQHAQEPSRLLDALARMDRDLADWINVARFDLAADAPGVALAQTCDAVARWAASRAGIEEDNALAGQFRTAAAQARDLSEVLRRLPRVTAAQLDRLVDQSCADGTGCEDERPELGCVHHVNAPGASIEAADDVFWWGFEAASTPFTSPWNEAEVAALASRGVRLLPASARFAWANTAALRPILTAGRRVWLFLPRTRGNEAVEHHSLHDRLDALVESGAPIIDIDSLVAAGAESLRTIFVAHCPLPPLRRWWRLDCGARLGAREIESFTSLEKFVYQPFSWVLKYKAGLRAGAVSKNQLLGDSRQRGNLLHRVVERLFAPGARIEWLTMTNGQFAIWLDQLWADLLATEGANLLMPGRRAEGERLRDQALRAVWCLVERLRLAGAVRIGVNVRPGDIGFNGSSLMGFIDLQAENASGARAVVDLKFGQFDRKASELKRNIPLQLALYGFLQANNNGGHWPHGAYFILGRRALLANDQAFFPDARVIPGSPATIGLAACWADFEHVEHWRRAQINGGWIELPLRGTDPTDGTEVEPSSIPPVPQWAQEEKEQRFDEFDALTGWRLQQ